MATYQVRAIILRHADTREADRLLTLYSYEVGKIVVIARGLRKISSKLAGSLEPLTEAQMSIAQGARLDTVIGVEALQTYRGVRQQEARIAVATYCMALADGLTRERQRDQRIYQLLSEILSVLDRSAALSTRELLMVRWYYIWRLLGLLGHQPELRQCVSCHQPLSATECRLSVIHGGMVHAAHGYSSDRSVTLTSLKLLRYIYQHDLPACLGVTFTTPVAQVMEPLTIAYLNHHAENDYSFAPFITG